MRSCWYTAPAGIRATGNPWRFTPISPVIDFCSSCHLGVKGIDPPGKRCEQVKPGKNSNYTRIDGTCLPEKLDENNSTTHQSKSIESEIFSIKNGVIVQRFCMSVLERFMIQILRYVGRFT